MSDALKWSAMRSSRHLLEPPAPEVVGECLDKIEQQAKRIEELEEDVACLESMMHRQDMDNLRLMLSRKARRTGMEEGDEDE